jgi:ribosomal-protein-alanine N-acetyltransferase
MPEKPEYTIEDASWRDVRALYELERICFSRDAWPLSDVMGVLLFPGVVRLRALAAGKLVGFIAGDPRRSHNVGWILTLGVLPDWRRKGIARALLAECEKRLGMGTIKLTVRKGNQAAVKLYEQFGYQITNVWPGYYRDGEDGLVMVKKLDAIL